MKRVDISHHKQGAKDVHVRQCTFSRRGPMDCGSLLWASGKDDPATKRGLAAMRHLVDRLYPEQEKLSDAQRQARSMDLVKVVLVHSYMDGLNFDLGRTRKCISRTVLPDGRLVPNCAYNVVHRGGPAASRPK